MAEVTGFELAKGLRPDEKVCYAQRITVWHRLLLTFWMPLIFALLMAYAIFVMGKDDGLELLSYLLPVLVLLATLRLSTPSGETVVTSARILSRSNIQGLQSVSLDEVALAQMISSTNFEYARLTLKDGDVRRIILFGGRSKFAESLPSEIKVISSPRNWSSAPRHSSTMIALPLFGGAAGFFLGLFLLFRLNDWFGGGTDSELGSVLLVLGLLIGPPGLFAYLGLLAGLRTTVNDLKASHRLIETIDIITREQGLDIDPPRHFDRWRWILFRRPLERALSRAYGQPVSLT